MSYIPVFAHRGASSIHLENTVQAFLAAVKEGTDGVEFDIHCTKDGVLVIYHDLNLYRLTGKQKNIDEVYAKELFEYKLGKNVFQRIFRRYYIPDFYRVLEWANFKQIPLNIELKESLLTNREPLIHLLKTGKFPKGTHFSSFHYELLQLVKMYRPEMETAFIPTKKFDWNTLLKDSIIDTIHANKRYFKASYLSIVEEAKKDIRFYNIDGSEAFLRNPHPNVVGWITDYPKRIKEIQKRR